MLGLTCGQSGGDQDGDAHPPPPQPVPSECIRCKGPPTFMQRGTAYCHDCFLQVLTSRFTRALEGARTVSASGFDAYDSPEMRPKRIEGVPSGKVLVACSGGASSRAVLELLKRSCFSHLVPAPAEPAPAATEADSSSGAKKKGKKHGLPKVPAFADCEVVYIDESSVPGGGDDRTNEISDIATSSTPFGFTALRLEDVFSPAYSSAPEPVIASTSSASLPIRPAEPNSSTAPMPMDQLLALLSPLSATSRASMLTSLRQALLLAHARARGASILLLGSTGTRLAVDMVSGMASGRGWSAGEEIGAEYVSRPATSRAGGPVLVVRPLALVSMREVRHLCETEGLRHVDPPLEVREVAEKETSAKGRSIGALVEDFILSLDASFPSTAQTVLRTAHKLGLRSSSPAARLCALCGLPAQPAADEWLRAITIADLIGAKAALAAEGAEASLPEGKGGARAPYAPSAAHLLPTAGPAPAVPAGDVSVPAEPVPAVDNAGTALAPHLCYGCLLVLQEPGSAPLSKSRARAIEIVLPPFVRDAVRARELTDAGDASREGVVGYREVHGEEAVRREVEGFLLADDA